MGVLLTTVNTVIINDLGGRTFTHPLVNYNLTDDVEYSYQEIRDSSNLGTALDSGEISIINDGEVVSDSSELKLVQPKQTPAGNINPSNIGGGAASMVMSFASGNSAYVESTSTTYQKLASFIFGGTDNIGDIQNININSWISNNGAVDVRLVCCGNGLVVAEFTGITSKDDTNVVNMGTISNLSLNADIIEVQGRKTSGGGGAKLRIGSLELEY